MWWQSKEKKKRENNGENVSPFPEMDVHSTIKRSPSMAVSIGTHTKKGCKGERPSYRQTTGRPWTLVTKASQKSCCLLPMSHGWACNRRISVASNKGMERKGSCSSAARRALEPCFSYASQVAFGIFFPLTPLLPLTQWFRRDNSSDEEGVEEQEDYALLTLCRGTAGASPSRRKRI